MSDSLEFTGERFTPECVREIWYEHFHRYALAARWSAGKRVLDAACGEGYGSAVLARNAASVDGVDISDQTIAHARERYGQVDGLEFHVADCTRLPFGDDEFDRIVSFETLEHLEAHDQLMAEFRRVLRPDGFLILSSPDKAIYTDQHQTENEYHVKELYREEFEDLIRRHFPASHLLGQKLVFNSAIWSMDEIDRVSFDQVSKNKAGADVLTSPVQMAQPAMYFIALCAADARLLPEVNGQLWLFDDSGESVYQHYNDEIRRHIAAGGIIARLEEELAELRNRPAEGVSVRQSWWRKLLGKS